MGNGILIIAAFILMMTSTTGVVSADRSIFENNSDMKISAITLQAGGWADLDIVASAPAGNAGMSGDLSVSVLDTAGEPVKGLQVVVNHKKISPGRIEVLSADDQVSMLDPDGGSDGPLTFNLKVKDVSGDAKKYVIKIEDTASGVQLARAIVEIKPLPRVSVPEFPTVALPVAVIMGLVFFFHRRQG